jgi:murein DD-endopeptidase MepM/ murein hydrolase activator NlpD
MPTHATAGLPGYPAIDVFGPAGAPVVAGFYGRVRRISGRPCSLGGTAGGAYGQSLYVRNGVTGTDRYLTHLDALHVSVGDRVWPRKVLGTVCDAAVSGKPGTSHVHYGKSA